MPKYEWDENRVRYELYQKGEEKSYNWLFLPGGAGVDSRYFRSLVDILDLPGNAWLIDLPGNGDNDVGEIDYESWVDLIIPTIKRFENPILVGHSFGGAFPLLFPELENILKGFVILGSAPTKWTEEAHVYAQQFTLPPFQEELLAFQENPCQETFEIALDACMPYYFHPDKLEEGRALVHSCPFPYRPAVWWLDYAERTHFNAKWIPQKVPTLILNGKYDCMCPYTLFEKDARFQRENIDRHVLDKAGHFVWMESPQEVRAAFDAFISRLPKKS